ncbi:proline-rich protein 13 isoform X2 [Marmota marmota marmota]|uniref:proline-rich protein 13 isoform X2 n=1 Tax=Marmota marmota marmota TaxID=9994 RepID=UPI002092178D|nr:proline-rich protein 13 isoform X2 [Marmota marmota marmota]
MGVTRKCELRLEEDGSSPGDCEKVTRLEETPEYVESQCRISRTSTLRSLPSSIPTTCPWYASCEPHGSWHGRPRNDNGQEDAEENEESS